MTNAKKTLITQSVLSCAGIAGVSFLVHYITGKAFNIPMMLLLMGSAIAGLLIAYTTGRIK